MPSDTALPVTAGQAYSLTERYRPFRFEHVVGQDEAVRYLKDRVLHESQQAILLVGPPGTGKTTLATIYANALLCQNNGAPGAKTDPEPCGRCSVCKTFIAGQRPFGYVPVDAARFKEHAVAKEYAGIGKAGSFGRVIIFIDEIHGFDDSAADALLDAVERPGMGSFFVMATTRPTAVRAALRSRCTAVDLHLVKPDAAYGLLKEVCELEKITFESKALHMLASRAEGSPREMLKTLEQVASSSAHLNVELVSRVLGMGWTSALLSYFRGLIAADLAAQEDPMTDWLEEPAVKARNLKEFMLFLHNYEIASPALSGVVNAAFHQITAEERREIVEGFRQRARRDAMNLDPYWCDLMSFWNRPESVADEAGFAIRRRQFNSLVNPQDAAPLPPPAPPPAPRNRLLRARSRREQAPVRGRNAAKKAAQAALGYLDQRDAEAIYDAASFLAQHYAKPFNAHFKLEHGKLGAGDEKSARELISKLTHELSLRIAQWSKNSDEAHWLYVNRNVDEEVATDLAMYIPVVCGRRAIEWLRQRLQELRPSQLPNAWTCQFPEAEYGHAPNKERGRMTRHWLIVRELWTGLDPAVVHWDMDGERKPLVALLGIPQKDRRAGGHLTNLRRMGSSRSLGPDRRRKAAMGRMAFLSAFKDCAWDEVTAGWELKEHPDRVSELERRKTERDVVLAEFPGEERLVARRQKEELEKLDASYPTDPHRRRRAWAGWWS